MRLLPLLLLPLLLLLLLLLAHLLLVHISFLLLLLMLMLSLSSHAPESSSTGLLQPLLLVQQLHVLLKGPSHWRGRPGSSKPLAS